MISPAVNECVTNLLFSELTLEAKAQQAPVTMSVIPIGVSPTDIVNGIKRLREAYRACSDNPNGSQQRYQRTRVAFNRRQQTLDGWLTLTATSSTISSNDVEVFKGASAAQATVRDQLDHFDGDLGSGSQTGPWERCKRKLEYAFGGSQDVQVLSGLVQPEIDAAMLSACR